MHNNNTENLYTNTEVDNGNDSDESMKKRLEKMLAVGSYVDTVHDVHVLYSEYARLMGFSVRKGTQLYFKNTLVVSTKLFHCSCEGRPDNKSSIGKLAAFKKQTYRSYCKARLRVVRADIKSPWKVSVFVNQHNHELLHPSESYLLRSSRVISDSKKRLLIAMQASGIGVSRAYHFMENEAGSRGNIGFTRKDAYNELHREARNLSKVDNGDANRLLEYLTERGMSDPSFYWKVKLSNDGRLKNLFFRDTRCLIDYQHFGDVVSVDATYKTNKYDLICVPLVGINHHRTNVMFGIAFLSNEKTESYEWLFKTFLESMYMREPSIIFSDQDLALMNGLDYSFRQASHRLCQWHINKNAVKHFGKLNQDKSFKNMWHRCMNGCETADQFEMSWESMIEQHNLCKNNWFRSMYNLKKRWSSAFTREKFSGGLRATSRSEVTNKVLKELCSCTSTLHDFVVGFERMLKTWRRREFEEDALCRGMPGMFVQETSILVQVGELCTRNVFKSFEYEALNSISVDLTQEPPDLNDEVLEYKVSSRTSVTGFRDVKFNQHTKFASCSCHLWETEGIICRHLFKVYFHLNQHKVPDEMILNRWRKDSKQRLSLCERSSDCPGPNKFSNMVFVNHNTKLVYDILTECKDDSLCRDAMNEYITKMIDAVKNLRVTTMGNTKDTANEQGFKEPLVRPISNPVTKKRRPYRRMRMSKNREARGYDGANTSNRTEEVQESLEGMTQQQFGSDKVYFPRFNDSPDRFSVD